jgi:ADP-ribosylglycohydrolase
MIGLIAGDIMGSVFESIQVKRKDVRIIEQCSRFTDDTVLALAVADAIMSKRPYDEVIREYGAKYPDAGYGAGFYKWLHSVEHKPYNSYGNGSAMRVGPVGLLFSTKDRVLIEARKTAEITHNHPRGIAGAQATALAVHLAYIGKSKEEIRDTVQKVFGYNLTRTLEEIRKDYTFQMSCDNTVPEALAAFLESESVEDSIRNAISLGGDSDTLAAIAGVIAEAYFKQVPSETVALVIKKLDVPLLKKLIEVYNFLEYNETKNEIRRLANAYLDLVNLQTEAVFRLSPLSNTLLVDFARFSSRNDPSKDIERLDQFNFENFVFDFTNYHGGFSAPQVGLLLLVIRKKRKAFLVNISHWVRDFLKGRDINQMVDVFETVEGVFKYLNEKTKIEMHELMLM